MDSEESSECQNSNPQHELIKHYERFRTINNASCSS